MTTKVKISLRPHFPLIVHYKSFGCCMTCWFRNLSCYFWFERRRMTRLGFQITEDHGWLRSTLVDGGKETDSVCDHCWRRPSSFPFNDIVVMSILTNRLRVQGQPVLRWSDWRCFIRRCPHDLTRVSSAKSDLRSEVLFNCSVFGKVFGICWFINHVSLGLISSFRIIWCLLTVVVFDRETFFSLLGKLESRRIDTIALPCWFRTIVKDMTHVSTTVTTSYFSSCQIGFQSQQQDVSSN